MKVEESNVRKTPLAPTPSNERARNPGVPLELDWIREVRVNRSAVERRTATLGTRRSVKKQWQAAGLLKAISCIDLTALSGDETPGRIRRICAKARQPVRQDILDSLEAGHLGLSTAAVCVYPEMVETAVRALEGSEIPVAAVSVGFPHGLSPYRVRLAGIEASVAVGAEELDIVITRQHVLAGNWEALFEEVSAYRKACGEAHLKTILATGELGTLKNVYKASLVCMMAGADFIKTSTGKEKVNATLPVGLVMARAIREYGQRTGYQAGFKPAGGINKAKQALVWLTLMKEELGNAWLEPALFRFGASSLLADIERQLEHYVSGPDGPPHPPGGADSGSYTGA